MAIIIYLKLLNEVKFKPSSNKTLETLRESLDTSDSIDFNFISKLITHFIRED